jgi:hypothetical protein
MERQTEKEGKQTNEKKQDNERECKAVLCFIACFGTLITNQICAKHDLTF